MALTVVAVLALAAFVRAAPQSGTCILNTPGRALGASTKSCSDCQWECLTKLNGACVSITFDGVTILYNDLDTWNCGDGKWLTRSSGLCVLYDANGTISDVQEQGCEECVQQCATWEQCAGIVFNFQNIPKSTFDEFVCPAPPPFSPAPVVPSPALPVPSPAIVVPSPAVPVPSPAVPVPSPAVPVPSPPVPVPKLSPAPSSPFIGINIVPGFCNVSNIRYTAPVVVTSVQSYSIVTGLNTSDSCCGLCKQDPRCNIMAFCSQPQGCGTDCIDGTAPFDQATEMGPGASCLPGGRYPLGTCQLQFAADYLAIPRDAVNFDGWLSALVVPELQSQWNQLPVLAVMPRM